MRRSAPGPEDGRVEHPVLVWERSSGSALEFPLEPHRPITIGRDVDSTVVLPSTFVSRAHARLEYRDGKYLVEDLGSANGTKVNGAPVAVSVVVPGDTIEIGEERLVFLDRVARSAAVAGAPRRGARLALVAVVTAVVMSGAMFALLRPSSPPAAGGGAAPAPGGAAPGPEAAARGGQAGRQPGVAPRIDSEAVRQVVADARLAGVAPVDALYDRGDLQYRTGRVREAADLFAAVLARDPKHERAQRMLRRCQEELERGTVERLARADSLLAQLRYDEAILQWEQVLQMVDTDDPRAVTARAGIDRAAKARAAR